MSYLIGPILLLVLMEIVWSPPIMMAIRYLLGKQIPFLLVVLEFLPVETSALLRS